MNRDSQGSRAKILDLFILSSFFRDGALLGFVCPHCPLMTWGLRASSAHCTRQRDLICTRLCAVMYLYVFEGICICIGSGVVPPLKTQEPSRYIDIRRCRYCCTCIIYIYIYYISRIFSDRRPCDPSSKHLPPSCRLTHPVPTTLSPQES